MIGPSGSNGESVPNETMNPLFLFELFHTTVVPALMQNNWLFWVLEFQALRWRSTHGPADVNGARRRARTAGVGRIAHTLGLTFLTRVLALLLGLRG